MPLTTSYTFASKMAASVVKDCVDADKQQKTEDEGTSSLSSSKKWSIHRMGELYAARCGLSDPIECSQDWHKEKLPKKRKTK